MLRRARLGLVVGGAAVTGLAVVQGFAIRGKYMASPKLDPPSGQLSGIERWRGGESLEELVHKAKSLVKELKGRVKDNEKLHQLEEKIDDLQEVISARLELARAKVKHLKAKIESAREKKAAALLEAPAAPGLMEKWRQINRLMWRQGGSGGGSGDEPSPASKEAPAATRRIRLLVLGDSLAAGVGCSASDESPVLPQVVARALSRKLCAEVDWVALGLVGGTVRDLRELLPEVKRLLAAGGGGGEEGVGAGAEREIVCVVLVGVNDWKTVCDDVFTGAGAGPWGFRRHLGALVADLAGLGASRVFMPAMPGALLDSDPSFSMGVWPVRHLAAFLCDLWDEQKRALAGEGLGPQRLQTGADSEAGAGAGVGGVTALTFIESPELDRAYATPGRGNVSADGVHPSSQGYSWWARWIAEHMAASMALGTETEAEPEP